MHRQRLQPAAPVGQGDRPVAVAVPQGMKPAPFAYHRPARLDEALALLSRLGRDALARSGDADEQDGDAPFCQRREP